MALYRATIIFEGQGHGWAETHVFSKTGTSPGGFAAQLVPWLSARAQLLGREYFIKGCRVSKIRDDLGAAVKRNVFPLEQIFRPGNQTAANSGDAPDAAIKVTGTNGAGDRSKQVFFGGVPDDVIVDGGIFSKDKVNWQANFVAWNTTSVQLGAGWLGFTVLNELPITTYARSAADVVTFTVAGVGFDPGSVGTQMLVRVRGLNNRKSVLNRQLIVFVESTTEAHTVDSIACGPYVNGGVMTIYDQPAGFIQAAGWSAVKTANHKRGRPLWVSPGRAPRRATT